MLPAEFNAHEFNTSLFNSNLLVTHLADAITPTEAIVKDVSKVLTDSQFLQDNGAQKTVSKGFIEEIRMSGWISKKRNPAQDSWSDQ